jgi:hypothetical protein
MRARVLWRKVDSPTGSDNLVGLQKTFLGRLNIAEVDAGMRFFEDLRRCLTGSDATGKKAFLSLLTIFSPSATLVKPAIFLKNYLLAECGNGLKAE